MVKNLFRVSELKKKCKNLIKKITKIHEPKVRWSSTDQDQQLKKKEKKKNVGHHLIEPRADVAMI